MRELKKEIGGCFTVPSPQVNGRFSDNITGISFYRQSCIMSIEDVLAKTDELKHPKYGIYSKDKDSILPSMKLLSDYVNEHQEFLRLPSNAIS